MTSQEKSLILLYAVVFIILAATHFFACFWTKTKDTISNKRHNPFLLIPMILVLLALVGVGVFFLFVTTYGISTSIFKHDQLLQHIATNIPNIIGVVTLIKSLSKVRG